MEKLNIAELLKDCPKGMELDCTMYEDVHFLDIDIKSNSYLIRITTPCGIKYLDKYGCYTTSNKAKCIIFPKGKTTWEGFQRTFKDGDIVTQKDGGLLVACIYKERKNTASFNYYIALYMSGLGIMQNGEIALPDDELRFATEKEKQKLFDVIKSNGYKWNAKTNTLEKLVETKFKVGDRIKQMGSDRYYIVKTIESDRYILHNNQFLRFADEHIYELAPNKFDITTLKPFDKVLVRCNELEVWHISFFEKYDRELTRYPFVCLNSNKYSQCIPYKDNEYLLGIADKCDNYYKTW